ncbi:MAG: HepT-like ribonuclease domain-containing protein, partial [bacterium]
TLPQEVRDLAPSIQWSKVIGMRNVLVHDYFGLDLTIIWEALQNDLSALKQGVEALIDILEKRSAT